MTEVGVELAVSGGERTSILAPVFLFDGAHNTEIEEAEHSITVFYEGHRVAYTFDGRAQAIEGDFFNRNGRYKGYKMYGKKLHIKID